MSNIILIAVCLLVGYLLQFSKSFPKNSYKALNQFVIYISMPALALYYIPKVSLGLDLLFPFSVAWLNFLLAYLFFNFIGKKYNWSNKLIGCLILCAGLGNTSFVGFPVIQALYGDEGLQTAVIVDQPGSFVVLSTVAVLVASKYSVKKGTNESLLAKLFAFPPFIGFLIGLLVNLLQVDFPVPLQEVFKTLGATVSPIALVAVGLQLHVQKKSPYYQFLWLGLFFKLMLFPAFILLLFRVVFQVDGLNIDVSVMEAAMAPMVTASILATNYGLKPKLSNMMIGVGIPLSFITLAFWYVFITYVIN
ncbi:AEC family transporter [Flavobacterium agricola]|uniref:AEC family transporter n=1 Tax=Flavobacterium agricola TaxID=2870839 RepID=A0ABY6M0F7_9FLAO|nr:AEC family transporter [Flavobacterium agricola]UYW00353.1 AEC family transporter [Flavobacterium agricola]